MSSELVDRLPQLAERPHNSHPIKILILIPTLAVGGAEMDLTRTLPRLDRGRFDVTVCTFLERGPLVEILMQHGVEVIGPFSPHLSLLRRLLLVMRRQKHALFSRLRSIWERRPRFGLVRSALALWPFRQLRELRIPATISRNVAYAFLRLHRAAAEAFRALSSSMWSVGYALQVVALARPIATYIRQHDVDIVHCILPNSYFVGACAALLSGRRPLIMSRVSLNFYQEQFGALSVLERRVLHRLVDTAIGNSAAILGELRAEGVDESKLRLVYNGIDVRSFTEQLVDRSRARRALDIPDGAIVFSVVANLHPYKGHRDLLLALEALRERLEPPWLCLVVGRDVQGQLPELRRICADYGLSRNVIFTGPRADIPIVLSAVDIHVSASHHEGLPNNVIEAMCAGLPVVATAVGGVPELVTDGCTGLLVPPKDPLRMSEALLALACSPDQRRMLGQAGYLRIANCFNIERNVAALESVYQPFVATRRATSRQPGSCT